MRVTREERMMAERFRWSYNETAMSRKISRRMYGKNGKPFDVVGREGPGVWFRLCRIGQLLIREKISPESFVQVIFRSLPKTGAIPWTRTFLREKSVLWYKTRLARFERQFPKKADRQMFFAGLRPDLDRIERLIKTTHKSFLPMRRAGFPLSDCVLANVSQISPWFLASGNGISPDALLVLDAETRDKIKRAKKYLEYRGWLTSLELLHALAGEG